MAKRRLYELAKARGLSSAELLEALKTAGVEGKSALSTMEEGDVDAALKKAGVDAKPQPAASENGQGPAPAEPADGRPPVGERIRMRRRLRHLRRVHKSQLQELAGLAVELYRLDSPRQDDLATERLKAAAETEDELIQLEQRLGTNDVSVECANCGLHTRRTRYCLRCGEKLPTAHGPQNLSATGVVVAVVAIAVAWLLGGVNFGSHSQNAATVTSRPLHAQNVRRGPSFRSYVATVKGSKIGIYHSPTDPAPYTRLSSPNGDGAKVAFLVKKLEAKWAYVYLPSRPNGSTGWIRRSRVTIGGDNYHVKINLSRHFLTAWKGKDRLLKTPVSVGRAVTPTPPGLYYITELLKPTDPTGTYGPYAFGLSVHSNVLHEFAGGDGVLGLHGTNYPQGIGTNVSHGCIRMANQSIIKLAHTLPIGTPVRIVGTA